VNGLAGQTWSSLPNLYAENSHSIYSGPAEKTPNTYTDQLYPISRTQQPVTTGTSVLGIKYDKGVLLAADTLASYGSLAKYDNITRLHTIGKNTCLAAGGDLSDFQYLQHLLDGKMREEEIQQDGHSLSSKQIYEWLSRLLYKRRSDMNPLWNYLLVAGWQKQEQEPFLAYVDLQGTTFASPSIATGFGAYIAQPLMRKAMEKKSGQPLTKEEAETVLLDCLRVLYYRDARSINKFQIASITAEGVEVSPPRAVDTEWNFAEKIRGYGPQTQ